MPAEIPVVKAETLKTWARLSFPELCTEIVSLFVPEEELSRDLVSQIAHLAAAKFEIPEGETST